MHVAVTHSHATPRWQNAKPLLDMVPFGGSWVKRCRRKRIERCVGLELGMLSTHSHFLEVKMIVELHIEEDITTLGLQQLQNAMFV